MRFYAQSLKPCQNPVLAHFLFVQVMTASCGCPRRLHGSNTHDFNRPSIAAPQHYRMVASRQLPIQFCAKCTKNFSTRKDGTTKFIINPFRAFVINFLFFGFIRVGHKTALAGRRKEEISFILPAMMLKSFTIYDCT